MERGTRRRISSGARNSGGGVRRLWKRREKGVGVPGLRIYRGKGRREAWRRGKGRRARPGLDGGGGVGHARDFVPSSKTGRLEAGPRPGEMLGRPSR